MTVVGFFATLLSLTNFPAQFFYLLKNSGTARHRNVDKKTFSGVSLLSVFFIFLSGVLWFFYGVRFSAPWVAVLAFAQVLTQVLIIFLLVKNIVASCKHVVVFVASMIIVVVVSLVFNQNVVGFFGAVFSAVMFVPQAVKSVAVYREPELLSYSLLSACCIFIANILWFFYGFLLKDFWLILPTPLHVLSSLIILGAAVKSFRNKNLRRESFVSNL